MSVLSDWVSVFFALKKARVVSLLSLALLLPFSHSALAKGTYYALPDLLAEVFEHKPERQTLWLNAEHKKQAQTIARKKLRQARVKYWQHQQRRFWVLSEIGKEKPITYGVVTHQGKIERIEVMVFREVRGDEIRLPAFTAQFKNIALTSDGKLDRSIDGISGATYSVRSMNKIAKLALLLDSWVAG